MANAKTKTVTKTANNSNPGDRPTGLELRPIREYRLSGLETFWYYMMVIFTVGAWYTVKVVIKKALTEKWDNQ